MKQKRILTTLTALILLTGCGADEPPDPVRTTGISSSVPETAATAATTSEEPQTLGMRIGYHGMAGLSDADAEALVSEILAQKKVELPSVESETYGKDLDAFIEIYELDMLLTNYLGSDLGRTTLELHESGWHFYHDLKPYEAPEALRQKVCEKMFESMKADMLPDDGEFEDNSLELETCGDVPEGSMWIAMQFNHAENLTKADVTLKDSSGTEIPAIITEAAPEYEGQMRDLYVLTGKLLRQGKHTLTVGKVSKEINVISAEEFIAAEKVRIEKEKAEKLEQRKKEKEEGIRNWYIPES